VEAIRLAKIGNPKLKKIVLQEQNDNKQYHSLERSLRVLLASSGYSEIVIDRIMKIIKSARARQ
jgi:hypothetical protein